MADEITIVDLSDTGELFAAMMFLAALAYPENHRDRDHFILALEAHCIRYAQRAKRMTRAAGSPVTRAIKAEQQRGTIRRGFRRILHRLQMAEVIQPQFLESMSTLSFQIHAGGSTTQSLQRLEADRRELFRTLKASKPVLHFAISLRSVVLTQKLHGFALLKSPGWIGGALTSAEAHAKLLQSLPSFGKTDLVRLKLSS